MAIKEIKELIKQHLIGRRQNPDPESLPAVFYLKTSFEQINGYFLPRLEIYPHCYRVDFPVGSYQVAHKKIRSATKFLLSKYLGCNPHYQIIFGKQISSESDEEEWAEAQIHQDFYDIFHVCKLS